MQSQGREQRQPQLDVLLDAPTRGAELASRLGSGLGSRTATLPRQVLLDGEGDDLEQRLEVAEAYYPARAERELVTGCAAAVHATIGPRSVLVLGPTPRGVVDAILAAGMEAGTLEEVVLADDRAEGVRAGCAGLADRYPALQVRGVVAHPFQDVALPAGSGPRLVVISGLGLGRLAGRERSKLWQLLAAELGPADAALFTADLLKDRHLITRAYDDPTGLQAALTRRALAQLGVTWGADLDPDGWAHRASWDERSRCVTMSALARGPQRIVAPALGVDRTFAAGDAIELERRTVFLGHGLDAELAFGGLGVRCRWTTGDQAYSLTLASA